VKSYIFLIGAAALLMAPGLAQAQLAPPAPTEQAAPAGAAPADPAPSPETPATAPATTASADGVTKEGGKYMKDGRKATKTEIAEFKKAEKAKPE
jgi:hypothetical protein